MGNKKINLTAVEARILLYKILEHGKLSDEAMSLTNQELGDRLLSIWTNNVDDKLDPFLFEILKRLGWQNREE